jgi:outer membrane receptor protein involved in Fe transport
MRLTAFIILAALSLVAFSSKAQTISFSGKDVPLKEIFAEIKTQTGILFFYDADLLKDAKPVTVQWKNVTLETALNEIFNEGPLTWVLENKTITVIKKPGQFPATTEAAPPLPPLVQVKGNIYDEAGRRLSGATVMIKGTNKGTLSDDAGEFSIKAEQKNVLVFSFVNYSSKEVSVEKGEMNIQLQLDIQPMEASLVGGNFFSMKRKAFATSVTVLNSKTLEKIPVITLDQVFRGWVPATTSYDIGGESLTPPNTLSIRGAGGAASLTPVAVYIDGIEYAGGSGYLSQLDKTNIDRIEIVRGPGAATMYGTGSNGGIVQIFTKKGRMGQSSVNFTSSAGFIKSKWVDDNPFQQMHNLESINGFKNVSLTLGGSYRTAGAYRPDGGTNDKGFYTGIKTNLGRFQANFMARYNAENFSQSRNPIYDTAIHPRTDIIVRPTPTTNTPAYIFFNVRPTVSRNKNGLKETFVSGVNLSHRTTENWVNNLDAGYTTNSSRELPKLDGVIPLQAQYLADKYKVTTIRYSNVLALPNSGNIAGSISSGAEYKQNSFSRTRTGAAAATTTITKDPDNKNYGAFIQANPSYKNVYLTLGLRFEKNNFFKAAWNPRLGITTNFDTRSLTIKPRISWGKGIAPVSYQNRFGQPTVNNITVIYENPDIKPQSQQGFDYGLEIYDKKGAFKFEAVYYDNVLKDMATLIALGKDIDNPTLSAFKYINVGKVINSGWEFSGEYQVKRFNLQGTFSIINAVLGDTTGNYLVPQTSQLRGKAPGTGMLYLPKHTAGFNLTYNFFKLFRKADKGSVSLNFTELDGVMVEDFNGYALDVAYGRTPYTGTTGYQIENPPVFRFGLYSDYHITGNFRFFIQGYNIFNNYKFEYLTSLTTHGAEWLFGIKYNYSKDK